MFIRPALDPASDKPGTRFKVRDPETMRFLADEGEEKPATDYWLRHQLHCGVELAEPPAPSDPAPPAKPAPPAHTEETR